VHKATATGRVAEFGLILLLLPKAVTHQVSVYDNESRKKMSFDDFILRSALRVKNINVLNRVRHAIRLNDLEMARSVLNTKVCHVMTSLLKI
jgi:hypothetical protein